MLGGSDDYVDPVGFAREPAQVRRHWLGRLLLGAFVVLLGFLLINGVLRPPDGTEPVRTEESTLPGPL